MHRLGEVLDGLFALVDELDLELVADLMTHHRRTFNAARARERFQPGRIYDDVADIDTDAKFGLAIIRHAGIAIMHAGLNFDSTARGIDHTAELEEERRRPSP